MGDLRDEWVPESTGDHIQSSDVYRILRDILYLFFHEHPGLCMGYIAIIIVQSIADAILVPKLKGNFVDVLRSVEGARQPSLSWGQLLTNIGTAKTSENKVTLFMAKFVGIMVLTIVLALSSDYLEAHLNPTFMKDIRNYIFTKKVVAHESDLTTLNTSEVLSDICTIPDICRNWFSLFLRSLVPQMILIFFTFVYLVILNWKSGSLMVGGIALVGLTMYLSLRNCAYIGIVRYAKFLGVNAEIQDRLENLVSIYMDDQIQKELQHAQKNEEELADIFTKMWICLTNLMLLPRIFNMVILFPYLLMNFHAWMRSEMSTANFLTALIVLGQFFRSMRYLSTGMYGVLYSISAVSFGMKDYSFAQFQDLAKEVLETPPPAIELSVHDVRFEHLHFKYPKSSKKLFDNLSFYIPHHAIFGIFGKSGTGKSSLLKLLLGFFTPDSGNILVGGHNIHQLHRRIIRRWFKLVCQRTFLFNSTVLDNILFGAGGGYSKTDVTRILSDLKLASIFNNLPQGLDTVCGPLGQKLSGGQKQIVLILRSLLNPSPILVLDEPTSALDPPSRQHVMHLIQSLQGQKTIIIVTHDNHLLNICTHTMHLKNPSAAEKE